MRSSLPPDLAPNSASAASKSGFGRHVELADEAILRPQLLLQRLQAFKVHVAGADEPPF